MMKMRRSAWAETLPERTAAQARPARMYRIGLLAFLGPQVFLAPVSDRHRDDDENTRQAVKAPLTPVHGLLTAVPRPPILPPMHGLNHICAICPEIIR